MVYTANLALSDAAKYGLDLLGTARIETLPCLDAAQLVTTLLRQGVQARIFWKNDRYLLCGVDVDILD